MGSLLSAISGQFAKVVTLGTLFPVLILSILNVMLVTPIFPNSALLQTQLKRIAGGETTWGAVALTFVVLVITGILYNLNIPIIRLYEGYPWQKSWIGTFLVRRQAKRLTEAQRLRSDSKKCLRRMLKVDPRNERVSALWTQYDALAFILNTELPGDEGDLLPTRLGNAIRSFELYSTSAYGIDAIVLWPRLIAKMDSAFASTIDEAKASFDFMLNCSFLSALTALSIVGIGLSKPTPLAWQNEAPWVWRAVFFGLIAIVFYEFSIGRAKAWGDQVKAAFDLYRLSLLDALGYKQKPVSYFEEMALWPKISSQLLFADSRESPLPYTSLPTRALALPPEIDLVITREFEPTLANGNIPVTIAIENKDRAQRTASAVKLIETVPEGFGYVVQTARASSGILRVCGLKPLEFAIDPIAPGTKIVVTYEIKSSSQSLASGSVQ